MKVTMDTERRLVLVDHCGAWLQLSPAAAQQLAHDLVMRAHELQRYYDHERTTIPKLSPSQVNDLLSDAGRPKKGETYAVRRQKEEKLSQERYNKVMFERGAMPTSVGFKYPVSPHDVHFKKEIATIEGLATERDLNACEVRAMLKYFPASEDDDVTAFNDDDLMTPFEG